MCISFCSKIYAASIFYTAFKNYWEFLEESKQKLSKKCNALHQSVTPTSLKELSNPLKFSFAGVFSSAITCTSVLVEKIIWNALMIAIKNAGLLAKWPCLMLLLIPETWKGVNTMVKKKRCVW